MFENKFVRKNEHADGQDQHTTGARPGVEPGEEIAGRMKSAKRTEYRCQTDEKKPCREFARSHAGGIRLNVVHGADGVDGVTERDFA